MAYGIKSMHAEVNENMSVCIQSIMNPYFLMSKIITIKPADVMELCLYCTWEEQMKFCSKLQWVNEVSI